VRKVGCQGHCDGHEAEGQVDGLGAVAAVGLALAHQRVVLLEYGLKRLRNRLLMVKQLEPALRS
jgi:hypothetical protein